MDNYLAKYQLEDAQFTLPKTGKVGFRKFVDVIEYEKRPHRKQSLGPTPEPRGKQLLHELESIANSFNQVKQIDVAYKPTTNIYATKVLPDGSEEVLIELEPQPIRSITPEQLVSISTVSAKRIPARGMLLRRQSARKPATTRDTESSAPTPTKISDAANASKSSISNSTEAKARAKGKSSSGRLSLQTGIASPRPPIKLDGKQKEVRATRPVMQKSSSRDLMHVHGSTRAHRLAEAQSRTALYDWTKQHRMKQLDELVTASRLHPRSSRVRSSSENHKKTRKKLKKLPGIPKNPYIAIPFQLGPKYAELPKRLKRLRQKAVIVSS